MNTTINKSLQLSKDINKSLDGITMGTDDKSVFPSLFHSLVIEHHRSVIILCENNLYSSAASLIRCIFEAYVKGLWFATFASEPDFEKLKSDSFNKDFYKMVNAIESQNKNGLRTAKERYWPNLNSLTHSGTAQLSRRIKGGEITSNFDDEFVIQMLKFSDSYALLSCGEIIKISGNSDAQKVFCKIIDKHDEFESVAQCIKGL